MLRLPAALREEFKEPLGPVYDDTDTLLAAVERAHRHADAKRSDAHTATPENEDGDESGGDAHDDEPPLIAVGDVVTYHLKRAGHSPDVAVVDGRTKREAVDESVRSVVDPGDADSIEVENEPGTLSRGLLGALREAIDRDGRITIQVEGEEDLATLPAILAAPDGASVVYGQPGEGMVHVAVAPATRADTRTLFSRLDGDVEAALSLLDG